jgi:hypothetical protein
MSRASGRRLALALLVLCGLVAGCAASSNPALARLPGLSRSLRGQIRAADRGVLAYRRLGRLTTGMTRHLVVSVTDVGKYEPFPTAFQEQQARRALAGYSIAPQSVPTGGYVQVRAAECVNLGCHRISSAVQPVVIRNRPVYWTWAITTRKPGPARITLFAVLYQGTTNRVLLQSQPIVIPAKVLATQAYKQRAAGGKAHPSWVSRAKGVLITLGAIAAAITAIAGAVVAVFKPARDVLARLRRRKKKAKRAPRKARGAARKKVAVPAAEEPKPDRPAQ